MSTGKESQPSMRFIKRNRHLTDESLPWAGIAFDPPVGSDELFHQLKSAYPSCDNLRQRKHLATIQFLIVELDAMRKKDSEQSKISKSAEDQETRYSNNPANGAADDLDYGCNPQHMPSSESPSGSSSVHSPELVDRSRTLVEDASGPAASSTLSREGEQIIVFDAKDGRSVQPRTKRRMTYEEKIAYKRKRRIGACDQCRRSKGRCPHENGPRVAQPLSPPHDTDNDLQSPVYVPPTLEPDSLPQKPHHPEPGPWDSVPVQPARPYPGYPLQSPSEPFFPSTPQFPEVFPFPPDLPFFHPWLGDHDPQVPDPPLANRNPTSKPDYP